MNSSFNLPIFDPCILGFLKTLVSYMAAFFYSLLCQPIEKFLREGAIVVRKITRLIVDLIGELC
jgi:hypothetical protein